MHLQGGTLQRQRRCHGPRETHRRGSGLLFKAASAWVIDSLLGAIASRRRLPARRTTLNLTGEGLRGFAPPNKFGGPAGVSDAVFLRSAQDNTAASPAKAAPQGWLGRATRGARIPARSSRVFGAQSPRGQTLPAALVARYPSVPAMSQSRAAAFALSQSSFVQPGNRCSWMPALDPSGRAGRKPGR